MSMDKNTNTGVQYSYKVKQHRPSKQNKTY